MFEWEEVGFWRLQVALVLAPVCKLGLNHDIVRAFFVRLVVLDYLRLWSYGVGMRLNSKLKCDQ